MLDDRVAIVTGAGRGIGRATAEILASLGAAVVVNDVDRGAADDAAASIAGAAFVVAGDLLANDSPDTLVAAAIAEFGRLDIVVNCAGYTRDGMAHTMADDSFREMLEMHTVVPFRVLRAAAPHLREPAKAERAEGREIFRKVVNVSSIAALGNVGQANYSAAKAGLIGLTRTLAKEWAPFRINVNAVAFGLIDTRLTEARTEASTISIAARTVHVGIPAEQREQMAAAIPFGRAGTAHEAAGPIAFLCSPWSDYVTGQVVTVGGGIPFGMSVS
jgi:3-oxoacyl-[acyl-carrier protein] reductase